MIGRLLNLLAAVSLLLCIAAVVLWLRSPTLDEGVSFTTAGRRTYSVTAVPHRLEFKRDAGFAAAWSDLHGWRGWSFPRVIRLPRAPPMVLAWEPPPRGALGFGWEASAGKMPGLGFVRLVVPFWALVAATAAPAALLIRRRLRERGRGRFRLCRSCGYDLRASPDRCPECGALPSAPPMPG